MLLVFLLLVTIVAVSVTWSNHLSRLAAEKTIRQAIDKGVLLDAELITRLRGSRRPRWDLRLIVAGIIAAFGGLGVSAFGLLLGLEDNDYDALFPMLAIGMGVLLPGVGFILAGLWLRRSGEN